MITFASSRHVGESWLACLTERSTETRLAWALPIFWLKRIIFTISGIVLLIHLSNIVQNIVLRGRSKKFRGTTRRTCERRAALHLGKGEAWVSIDFAAPPTGARRGALDQYLCP